MAERQTRKLPTSHFTATLAKADPVVAEQINSEAVRQNDGLELIASENFVSMAVLEAMGSVMTNKYAEGYPGKRYYGGCEFVDEAEELARTRAKELFGAAYANVQPHSGSNANMAVYRACLNKGDKVLGMALDHGGHLTHGSPVNFSGQDYNCFFYGVSKQTGLIDYSQVREIAQREKPRMITVGASAHPREIDYEHFREIADSVGALLFADIAHPAGLIAVGLLQSPIGHAHVITTTTHKTLRGPRGGMILLGEDFENPLKIKAPIGGRILSMSEVLDKTIIPGIQGGPLMHVIAAKAVALGENLQPAYYDYCRAVISNAKTLAFVLKDRGFNVLSDGTDNHLILIDLRNKGMTGKLAQDTLQGVSITVNKNSVPFETESPLVTSGIRLGTPALTTRGMGSAEMETIGNLIADALEDIDRESHRVTVGDITHQVHRLAREFPMYEV